jgi:uncharacterized protein (DUF362 family)
MSDVSIVKCLEVSDLGKIKNNLRKAIALIGGINSRLLKNDSVLIKPNILSDLDFKTGATTNPYLIEAIIDLLREFGIKKITIAEGSIVGKNTDISFKKCGIDKLAERKKVRLVDLKKDEFIPLGIAGGKILKILKLPRSFIDSDFVINIPVIKTHDSFPATLGLKNMKGIIRESDKRRFHLLGLAQCIVDLNRIAIPHLAILDGIVGMEGIGPLSGEPADLGVLIASYDTVAADAIASRVMGIDPYSIKYLRLAEEQGLGSLDEKEIEVRGEKIKDVYKRFKLAEADLDRFKKYGINIIEGGACSGCKHTIETFLIKSESRGKIENLKGCTFIMGQNAKPPEYRNSKIFNFGSCTKKIECEGSVYIPGCPPHMDIIREAIKRKEGHYW